MTEQEWLKSSDPMQMLIHVKAVPNTRKVLLLTVASRADLRLIGQDVDVVQKAVGELLAPGQCREQSGQ